MNSQTGWFLVFLVPAVFAHFTSSVGNGLVASNGLKGGQKLGDKSGDPLNGKAQNVKDLDKKLNDPPAILDKILSDPLQVKEKSKDWMESKMMKYNQEKANKKETWHKLEEKKMKKNLQNKNEKSADRFIEKIPRKMGNDAEIQAEKTKIKQILTETSLKGNIGDKESRGELLDKNLNQQPRQRNLESKNTPDVLKIQSYDESENIIEDADDYDREMKRQKKKMWSENLIPKSNKFLYNNKKYPIDLPYQKGKEIINKDAPTHSRKRRDTLQSIFVQMPGEEDEFEKRRFSLDQDYQDKKSKSTTVCLEIKSDPTKPPATICGPEIKPSSAPYVDPTVYPHLYSVGQQVPNNLYYTEPTPDKTIFMNHIQDPILYFPLPNYKNQMRNREETAQDSLIGNTLDNKKSNALDRTNQKKTSMNNFLSEDNPETLKTKPGGNLQNDNGIRDLGQTSSMLSENKRVSEKYRNEFKDLDLNLDAEMSANLDTYINPNTLSSYNNYEPKISLNYLLNGYGTEFNTDQFNFYPFTNYDSNVGSLSGQGGSLVNDPQIGLNFGGEIKQPVLDESSSGYLQNSEFLSNEPLDIRSLQDLNQAESGIINPSVISVTSPRGSFEYLPDYPKYTKMYPYKPITYPYEQPPRPYRPQHGYDSYDPDCRNGRCRSVEKASMESPALPWNHIIVNGQPSEIIGATVIDSNLQGRSESDSEIDPSFRGNVYYGRRYPYRPPHDFDYPRPHRFPPSASYPYHPPSDSSGYGYPYDPNCRTADGRSCRDSEAENRDVNISPSNEYITYIDPRNKNPTESRSTLDWSPLDASPSEKQVLGATLDFRTHAHTTPGVKPLIKPPHIAPMHVPVGLSCNVVHAPVIPPVHTQVPVLPVKPGHLTIGGGHGIGGGAVFSGVGTHGIGGSHGLSHHHLLREGNPLGGETENKREDLVEENITGDDKPYTGEKSADAKVKAKTRTLEEIKEEIREKLRAADEKYQSSKAAILGKINRNIVKEKRITEPETDTDQTNKEIEIPSDSESGSTFNNPAVLQLPTGGTLAYNMNPAIGNIPMLLGSTFLGASPSGASGINIKTPLGSTITYDSPLLGYGQSNLGAAAPWYYSGPGQYPSAQLYGQYPVNVGAYSLINHPVKVYEKSASPSLSVNAPLVGASLVGSKAEAPPMPAYLPCAQNSGKDVLGSSLNAQLAPQAILSPIQTQKSPVGFSFRAPIVGSIQYQQPLNAQMFQSVPSPIVGFASLAEMKDRENQLKESNDYDYINQNGYNLNNYEENYKSNIEDKGNCNSASRNSGESTNVVKVTSKKPQFKAVAELPSKIVTTKSLSVPIVRLPMPKPLPKSANLRASVKVPCA